MGNTDTVNIDKSNNRRGKAATSTFVDNLSAPVVTDNLSSPQPEAPSGGGGFMPPNGLPPQTPNPTSPTTTDPRVMEWIEQQQAPTVGANTTSSDYFPNMGQPVTQAGYGGMPTYAASGVMPYAVADAYRMEEVALKQAQEEKLAADIEADRAETLHVEDVRRDTRFGQTQVQGYNDYYSKSLKILNENPETAGLSIQEKNKLIYESDGYQELKRKYYHIQQIDNYYGGRAKEIIADYKNNGASSQYSKAQYDYALEFNNALEQSMFEDTPEAYEKLTKANIMFQNYAGLDDVVTRITTGIKDEIVSDFKVAYGDVDFDTVEGRKFYNNWMYKNPKMDADGHVISYDDYSDRFKDLVSIDIDHSYGNSFGDKKERDKLYKDALLKTELRIKRGVESNVKTASTKSRTDQAKYDRETIELPWVEDGTMNVQIGDGSFSFDVKADYTKGYTTPVGTEIPMLDNQQVYTRQGGKLVLTNVVGGRKLTEGQEAVYQQPRYYENYTVNGQNIGNVYIADRYAADYYEDDDGVMRKESSYVSTDIIPADDKNINAVETAVQQNRQSIPDNYGNLNPANARRVNSSSSSTGGVYNQ